MQMIGLSGAVVSVITNNLLSAVAEPARLAADWLVRDLQIASGRDNLLEAVANLAAQQDDSLEFSDNYQRRINAATAALPALTQIAQALDELPHEASPSDWTAVLAKLGEQLGFAPPHNSIDLAAWNAIIGHFAALERTQSLDGRVATQARPP